MSPDWNRVQQLSYEIDGENIFVVDSSTFVMLKIPICENNQLSSSATTIQLPTAGQSERVLSVSFTSDMVILAASEIVSVGVHLFL